MLKPMFIVFLLLLLTLSACDDGTVTRSQGAAGGAVIGAIIGNQFDSPKTGALIGAAIGLAIGDNIARRKAAYASMEDQLDGEIQYAAQFLDSTRSYNASLAREVQSYRAEIAALNRDIARGRANKSTLVAQKKAVDSKYREASSKLDVVSKEYKAATETAAAAKTSGEDASKIATYEKSISGLAKEKAALESHVASLSAMSSSIAL